MKKEKYKKIKGNKRKTKIKSPKGAC